MSQIDLLKSEKSRTENIEAELNSSLRDFGNLQCYIAQLETENNALKVVDFFFNY